ncbi:MAG TPA: hypothetical protein VKT49_09435 [Bryobacteraceae bacterium]|nr:hypothetical protein [Bryobacteraceae bacterium]
MRLRNHTFLGAAAAVVMLLPGQITAQSVNAKPAKTESQTWTVPRTGFGQPDLQGVWANNNATPLERPKVLAGRPYLTEQEVAALKKKAHELFDDGNSDAAFGDSVFTSVLANVKGEKAGFKSTDGQTGDYSSVWLVERNFDNRTSLITDPAEGRLPALTPQAKERQVAAAARRNRLPEGPEDRSLSERCITFGAPRLGAGYNSYYQIVQSPDAVVMIMETIHDARIIPLDGRPHVPASVHEWLGDSRGHWEGDTLVVDTTNYRAGAFMNASDKLHIVERFTRTGPETLKYEVTVDDPDTWTKPWSAMIPLSHSRDFIFEYACHEGNEGLAGILSGARAEEKAAAAGK